MYRTQRFTLALLFVSALSISAFAQAPGQVRAELSQAHKKYITINPRALRGRGSAQIQTGSAKTFNSISGIDSLVNFTGDFEAPGFDPNKHDVVEQPVCEGGTHVGG